MVGDSVALSNTFRSERTRWAPSQRAPGASGKHSAPPRAEVRLRGRGVRCARVLRELTPWCSPRFRSKAATPAERERETCSKGVPRASQDEGPDDGMDGSGPAILFQHGGLVLNAKDLSITGMVGTGLPVFTG